MSSLLALLFAAQALPAEIALASSEPAAPAASGERMICRQRPSTGTRLRPVRTCMTAREWNERRENITRGMRDFTTREMASQRPPPTTAGSE